MTKRFLVSRGRDAWVIEEAVVEVEGVETPEQAQEWARWKANAGSLEWVVTDDIRTFDDTEIMEGITYDMGETE